MCAGWTDRRTGHKHRLVPPGPWQGVPGGPWPPSAVGQHWAPTRPPCGPSVGTRSLGLPWHRGHCGGSSTRWHTRLCRRVTWHTCQDVAHMCGDMAQVYQHVAHTCWGTANLLDVAHDLGHGTSVGMRHTRVGTWHKCRDVAHTRRDVAHTWGSPRTHLRRGRGAVPADRAWSCCARTCCRTRPGRARPRSPSSTPPPAGQPGPPRHPSVTPVSPPCPRPLCANTREQTRTRVAVHACTRVCVWTCRGVFTVPAGGPRAPGDTPARPRCPCTPLPLRRGLGCSPGAARLYANWIGR